MSSDEMASKKKSRGRSGSSGKTISMRKGKKESMRKSRTKFEEFLAMDMNKGMVGAKEDLEMERRLAKKLKVKGGKFKHSDDGINKFIKGIPSVLDDGVPLGDEIVTKDDVNGDEVMKPVSSGKKRKRKKSSQPSTRPEDETVDGEEDANVLGPISASEEHKMKKSFQPSGKNPEHGNGDDLHKTEEDISGEDNMEPETLNEEPPQQAPIVDVSAKYVAPRLRACANKESEELSQIRRRVRGMYFCFNLCKDLV